MNHHPVELNHVTETEGHYRILPRHVRFDFSQTPIQWVPGDPASTHVMNTLNLMFPAGEMWFCRVYNKALPLITDPKLRDDAEGFLRQEALHSRSHGGVLKHYYQRHGIDTAPFTRVLDWSLTKLLGDRPWGLRWGGQSRFWLRQRLGIIAALEHFFGYLGNWVLNAPALDKAGTDPVMLDLLRWHGAEEVEHRSVAYDIYRHLGGGYFGRCFHMACVIPMLLVTTSLGARFMYRHDPDAGKPMGLFRTWSQGAQRGCLPSLWDTVKSALRFFKPAYSPGHEGSTEQALAYLDRSPAAQAAAHGGNWVKPTAPRAEALVPAA